jgi:hypothetical protein
VFPNQNLTGVGAGAAITPALDARGFGGDTDGFYQRRGCGLSKVSSCKARYHPRQYTVVSIYHDST